MRVMFLSTTMGMGGADQQLLTLAGGLRARGHEVMIVSLTPLGPMGLEARALGIATESLEMRRGVPDPRGLLRLIRLVRAWRPDVLHSHMIHANLMARVLRLIAPVPALVSTIHSIYDGGRLRMAAYRLTNRLVDQMTIISQTAADRFISERIIPEKLLRVIPNSVDTDRFRNVPAGTRESVRRSLGIQGQFAWLAVGRFEVAKDYPNMLHAFASVRARHPEALLLLVGRGSLQTETEAMTEALGLADNVRFLGVRRDVPEVMSAADGYLMSSAWEGMPIVLLEAAAAGLPIVATRVGGNQEVVQHEDTGFLVPPRDSEALAGAMLRLMELADTERRALGDRGCERVRTFYGSSQTVERWEQLYRQVLSRNGLSPSAPLNDESARLVATGQRSCGGAPGIADGQ
jgi:glycosyltransferase involved in cell wall biosynthesis